MRNYISFFMLISLIVSCDKITVKPPSDFQFQILPLTADTQYFVADTFYVHQNDTCNFSFSGTPDYISFFSDEPGYQYDRRTSTTAIPDSVMLDFQSSYSLATYKNASGAVVPYIPVQECNYQVLFSTNFNGNYDSLDIASANWQSIQDTNLVSKTATPMSSNLNLASLIKGGADSFYVAFLFKTSNDSLKQRLRTQKGDVLNLAYMSIISYFNNKPITSIMDLNQYNLANTNINWGGIYLSPNTDYQITITHNQPFRGEAAQNDWFITRAIYPFNNPEDVAKVVVKNMYQTIKTFNYVFTTPGLYHIAFLAINANINGTQQVVRKAWIRVQ